MYEREYYDAMAADEMEMMREMELDLEPMMEPERPRVMVSTYEPTEEDLADAYEADMRLKEYFSKRLREMAEEREELRVCGRVYMVDEWHPVCRIIDP